jgi:methylmalonyl-CoA/ethylmalonyl-CoA epimerase
LYLLNSHETKKIGGEKVSMKVNRFKVREINQIGIVVKDIKKAMEAHTKTLGIGPWTILDFSPPALTKTMVRGKPVNYSMTLALTQVGSVQVELIEPLEGPSVYKEFLKEKGEGLHHIQSQIDDVDDTLAAFKEIGVDVLMSGKYGDAEFFYFDTEPLLGIIYEVVKMK